MKKAVIYNVKSGGYINIGNNRSIPVSGILGIFDMDTATQSKELRAWLRECERGGETITVANSLPKSLILFDDGLQRTVYFSSFTADALYKRTK